MELEFDFHYSQETAFPVESTEENAPLDSVDEAGWRDPQRSGDLGIAADTHIKTERGFVFARGLTSGDRVIFEDGRTAKVTEVMQTSFSADTLRDHPELAPIRFDAGSLGAARPSRAVLFSPECRIGIGDATGDTDAAMISARVPARQFINGSTIRRVIPEDGIRYVMVGLDDGGFIRVEGLYFSTRSKRRHLLPMAPPLSALSSV